MKHRVIYIGKRYNGKSLSMSFIKIGPHGTEYSFRGRGFHQIGRTYVLEEKPKGSFLWPVHGLEEDKNQHKVPEAQIEKWEIQHFADIKKHKKNLARKKAKEVSLKLFADNLGPILERYLNMKWNERIELERALVEWLREQRRKI